MEISERIKSRRLELGLSAEELACELGVSRATIYRYESAEIKNMGVDKVEPLAKALLTTPAYLMGWTNDPTDYEDPELIASLSPELLRHFDGDVEKAVAAQRTIEKDQEADSNKRYAINTIAARLEDKDLTPKKLKLLEKYIDALFDEGNEE